MKYWIKIGGKIENPAQNEEAYLSKKVVINSRSFFTQQRASGIEK